MSDEQVSDAPSGVGMAIRLGAATLSIVNVGDSLWTAAEILDLPEAERAAHPALFEPRPYPTQCVHFALPGASVLVDAPAYDFPPDSPQVPAGYVPPPGVVATLATLGVAPEEVGHVVITHPHFDHINGLTCRDDEHLDRWRPCFPRARHYFGARDWDSPELREALAEPDSLEARTLGVLHAAGLLELLDGEREITAGVRIVPAPGESPGHQIVRVESEGLVAYSLGDLYHSAAEVKHPEQMAAWSDRAAMEASRRALVSAALAEDALLVSAHIPGAGRLVADGAGVRWQPVG